jgi:hypothetical protein
MSLASFKVFVEFFERRSHILTMFLLEDESDMGSSHTYLLAL